MAKELTVHKIDFIEGGVSDFIFWGTTDTGKRVKFWMTQETVIELSERTKIAGSPGHAIWHRRDNSKMPCEMCTGAERAQIEELELKMHLLDPEQEGEEYEGKRDGLLAQIDDIKKNIMREKGISL